MSDFKPYLQSAHIEGYKSIVSCDVTFKPGLNIIIGKNGTGKTNLLEAVWMGILARNYGHFLNGLEAFESVILYQDIHGGKREIKLHVGTKESKGFGWRATTRELITDDGEVFHQIIDAQWLPFFVHLFRHGIPKGTPLMDNKAIGWSFQKGTGTASLAGDPDPKPWHMIGAILQKVKNEIAKANTKLEFAPETMTEVVTKALESAIQKLMPTITQTTPIQDISVSKGSVNDTPLEDKFEINGFSFRFRVSDHWLQFDQLSDGTKRILLMVIEVMMDERIEGYYHRLFLLEEPELGIHPHQLQLLMNFLMEQSQEKQIILTTHAPEVLNILDEDEFDRIIIAEFDPKNGSTFRNLKDTEIDKAKQYVEAGLQFSDYWKFSDLEPHAI
jgi:predicted ATPase